MQALDGAAEPFLALAQRVLGLFALGDVPGDAGEQAPPGDPHFTDLQLHREGRAVLAPAVDDAPLADDLGLPGIQIVGKVAIMLGTAGLGQQHPDVIAHHLVRRIAEHVLGPRTEGLDDARLVDGDDADDHAVDDRPHALLALAQRLFRPLAGGDVGADAAVAPEHSIGVEDGRAAGPEMERPAIGRIELVPEIPERPVCLEVGQMIAPYFVANISLPHLGAGLAQHVDRIDPRHRPEPVREIREPQVFVHFPEPVRGRFGHVPGP